MSTVQHVQSLRNRIVTASLWVTGAHVISQALRLGSNLIMTRLLAPEMFGVMALANVLIIGLALFSDIGLRQNIVQSQRGNDPAFLNTAWTIQIIRGALICLLAIVLAISLYFMNVSGWLPEDSVYAEPTLPYIIAVLSLAALISGFRSTKLATANRSLSMGKITRIELMSQVSGLVFMITLALIDQSVWVLVIGTLFAGLVYTLLSHFALSGEKNKLHWDIQAFWEIFHFGKWVFLTSILVFLANNGDRLFLGGFVDSSTLGVYGIAFFMVHAIQQVISKIVGSVAFPALSEVARERLSGLKGTYYKFRLPVDAITLFFTGFLFMAGHLLIELLYDERYHDAGYMLEILSVSLFMERYNLAGQCFMALGKPKLLAPIIFVRLGVLFIFFPIVFSWFGLGASLWVIVGARVAVLPLIVYLKIRYNIFDMVKEFRVLPFLFLGYILGWAINQAV